MSWLHEQPTPPPPMPPRVALGELLAAIAQQEAAGQATPASAYLRLMCPPVSYDKWGEPLPLSDDQQDRVDRLFAVLAEPLERTHKLLRSGLLMAEEVDAVKTAFPEVYTVAVEKTLRELMASAPPYREWAETAIGVLFGMPPAQLLQSAEAPEKQMAAAESKAKPKTKTPGNTPDMSGTAADRREISVRKELR